MESIAIVGIGCLFPGARSAEEYWQNLIDKKDLSTPLSSDLIGADPSLYYDSTPGSVDKINYHKNGHIRDFEFDPTGYQLPESELMNLDNLFKWTMYASRCAYQDANIGSAENKRCGLLLGNIGMPTHAGKQIYNSFYGKLLTPYIRELLDDDRFDYGRYWDGKGISKKTLSTASLNAILTAQALGIQGPCYTLDAACSSAIYAIQLASFYLETGKADVMLAGAVCHADHIYIDHGFNILRAFPGVGKSSIPFDSGSDGLKAGEGAGVVALKRLSAAERDGNKIYGVIRSIGLSNDGGSKHILVPDQHGQLLALKRAYQQDNTGIDYLECHATGTPVGDQVELNTVERFFTKHSKIPYIGANKGNIGHMLTASGMASLLKIVLSMEKGIIPGTIALSNMVKTRESRLSIDHVVREAMPWPVKNAGEAKRAAINAFGFGGVNGHMIIEEYISRGEIATQENTPKSLPGDILSIVGIGVAMANTQQVREFNEVIRTTRSMADALPKTRWSGLESRVDLLQPRHMLSPPRGAYIEKFDFDCKRFKLPPNVAGLHLLSHMSLMQLAAAAYYDAGFELSDEKRNIGVIVASDNDHLCYRYQARNEAAWQVRDSLIRSGITLSADQVSALEKIVKDSLFPEPYTEGITGGINNVVASRISAHLKLNGPALTICSQENSVFRAIELAQFFLSLSDMDAVIIGTGSFCGGLENILSANEASPANYGNFSLSFEQGATGWNVGEGGGVVILQRKSDAVREGRKTYANIEALAFSQIEQKANFDFIPAAKGISQAANQALKQANIAPEQVAYIEAHASGIRAEDDAEISALSDLYGVDAPTYLGSVKANYGHLGSASGMASLIKVCLSLSQRYIAGTPNWSKSRYAVLNGETGLTVARETLSWDCNEGEKRYAAINSLGADYTYTHAILSEPDKALLKTDIKNIDEAILRENALTKTIYIGGEKTIPAMIVNDHNKALFPRRNTECNETFPQSPRAEIILETISGQADVYSVSDVQSVSPTVLQTSVANMCRAEAERSKRTHGFYLATESQFYQRLDGMMRVPKRVLTSSGEFPHISKLKSRQAAISTPLSQAFDEGSPESPVKDHKIVRFDQGKRRQSYLFDEDQLLEMTNGSVAKVLGDGYAEADKYAIRTRMPSPPYMFASRIISLTAEKGKLEPCEIEWEYDLTPNAWYVYHGRVPAFVTLESSHAMIVAFTFIGCDQLFKGALRYRAIDSKTQIFGEMPRAGDVLRGRVKVHSFTKVGKTVLINYEYDGYVDNRHAFKLTATSGFFPAQDIARSKSVDTKKIFANARKQAPANPILVCQKTSFSDADIAAVQAGDLRGCFGEFYGTAPAPGLYADKAKMLDRITSVSLAGGAWGLGQITGEYDVDPGHWAFKAHFKNDPVLPGTLIVEGAEQVFRFFLYYLGVHTEKTLVPSLIEGHHYSAKFRGEVKCARETLQYRLSIKEYLIKRDRNGAICELFVIAVAETIYCNKVIGICDNLGAKFVASHSS